MANRIATEFPEFPAETFPATLPGGFADESWHNDVCPSLVNEALGLQIFCDHPDAAERECGGPRFTVAELEDASVLAEAEEWAGIEAWLASRGVGA